MRHAPPHAAPDAVDARLGGDPLAEGLALHLERWALALGADAALARQIAAIGRALSRAARLRQRQADVAQARRWRRPCPRTSAPRCKPCSDAASSARPRHRGPTRSSSTTRAGSTCTAISRSNAASRSASFAPRGLRRSRCKARSRRG